MAEAKTKKSPAFLFLGVFVVIVIVMFIANQRSALVEEMRLPFNQGMRGLTTYGNSLMAVSSDGKIFVWDWNNLSNKPQTGSVESEQAVLLGLDLVASLRVAGSKALVLTDIKSDETRKEISVGFGSESKAYLCASSSRDVLAVILADEEKGATGSRYQFLTIDLDAGRALKILDVTGQEGGLQLTDFAVSDDGKFIVGVGAKGEEAFMLLIDLKSKKVILKKTLPEAKRLTSVIFSKGAEEIYAGSDDSLYKLQTDSGALLSRIQVTEKVETAHKPIPIQYIAASPDGKLVAVTLFQSLYIFECAMGRCIFKKSSGHKLAGALAFSPDSNFLATSDLRQGGTVKIWKVPQY
jgi:WD40 repeat protein